MKRARDPDLIRSAMAARGGLTLRELATLAGCSGGMISFILAGRATTPELARRIARTLRRPVDELFEAASSTTEPSNVNHKAAS